VLAEDEVGLVVAGAPRRSTCCCGRAGDDGSAMAVASKRRIALPCAARPHVAFLGRIPGMDRYSDLDRNPDNEPVPGALLFRCEASLL
jgi:hypothetical protein